MSVACTENGKDFCKKRKVTHRQKKKQNRNKLSSTKRGGGEGWDVGS